jgi:hypothetical protein
MRKVMTIMAGFSLVLLGQGLTAQQGRGGGGGGGGKPTSPEAIPAMATYESSPSIVSAISGGPYAGEIGELQFTAVEQVELTFDCGLIVPLDGAPDFPGCDNAATVTVTAAPGFRHMPILPLSPNPDCEEEGATVGCDGFAKQHIISWKVGKTQYSLQWVLSDGGQPPDYPRVECLETRGRVDDDRCIAATMDTTDGIYDSSVDTGIASPRETGSVAWLRAGGGSKFVGFYEVPFAMHVEADLAAPASVDRW